MQHDLNLDGHEDEEAGLFSILTFYFGLGENSVLIVPQCPHLQCCNFNDPPLPGDPIPIILSQHCDYFIQFNDTLLRPKD